MSENDLIVRRAIPFGDMTEGELHEEASMQRDMINAHIADVQRNPKAGKEPIIVDAYNRFYIPIGEQIVNLAPFYHVSKKVGLAESVGKIRQMLQGLLDAAAAGYNDDTKYRKSAYFRAVAQLNAWLEDPVHLKPPRPIFAKSNKKLPFWCFSTLPGTTCPGAGACLKNSAGDRGWCYSFSAWRNIFPYFRELQNTLLIRLADKRHILNDMRKKFKPGQVVRLYVDGDMDSLETLEFWMDVCRQFPQNRFYGYSKSWELFLDWHEKYGGYWPENYVLNLSSGSKYVDGYGGRSESEWIAMMRSLRHPKTGDPLVRGRFIAVPVPTPFPDKDKIKEGELTPKEIKQGWKSAVDFEETKLQYKREVREKVALTAQKMGVKAFVCPNYCGDCLHGAHACGNRGMQNVLIAIGIH